MAELLAIGQLAVLGVMVRRVVLEAAARAWEPGRDRLYCRREGRGSAMLFLHGLAGSWRYWRRGLAGLAGAHRLHVPDLLGFGRSPKPRGDYSAAMHAEAVARLLQEIGTVEVVVGHSMGAIIALELYSRFPDRIGRLVLLGLPSFPSRAEAVAALTRGWFLNRAMINGSRLAQAMCYMKDLWALPIFAPLAGVPVDLYRDYWKHTWLSASRSLLNTVLAFDAPRSLERVDRTRITLVHGRTDRVSPIEHVRGLAARFPDLALLELDGDHHVYLTDALAVNRVITGGAFSGRRWPR
jgi:pimeloyl-ACP methyl ester carboxylesterase